MTTNEEEPVNRTARKQRPWAGALGWVSELGQSRGRRGHRIWASGLALAALTLSPPAAARPNTHAPAISTWDPRASSVVFGLGSSVSGDGGFTLASYNANFSSTNGILSAQFGVHYVTYKDSDTAPTARGVSAGGVALISLPLAERFENGVPRSSFAFYIGGVPTALFSGQLNFISVPLVLGVGLPFSPSPWVTFRPWVELSPGLNFDTHIQAIVTAEAVASAMDGTLTRDEVEDLVRQGLGITQETTVGKRAGLSFAIHLGQRVDFDSNLFIGAGHAGSVALSGALVFRWDSMVPGSRSERAPREDEDCAAIEARFRSCPAAQHSRWPSASAPNAPPPATPPAPAPGISGARSGLRPMPARQRPRSARPPAARGVTPNPDQQNAPVPQATPQTRRAAPPAPAPTVAAPAKKAKPDELPPLQAAPPRKQ
jgi:hypothetical protein